MKKIIIILYFSILCQGVYAYTVYQTTGVTSNWNLTTTWNTGTIPPQGVWDATLMEWIPLASGPEIIVKAGHTLNITTTPTSKTWVGRCTVEAGATLNLNGFDLRVSSADSSFFPPCILVVDGTITGVGTVYMDYANNSGTFSGTGLLNNTGGIFLHPFNTYDIPLGSNLTVTNGVGLNNRDTWISITSPWGALAGVVSIAGTLNVTNGNVEIGHPTNSGGRCRLAISSTGSLNITNGNMVIVRSYGTTATSSSTHFPTIVNSGYVEIGGSLLLGSNYVPSGIHNYIGFNNNAGSTLLVKGAVFPRDASYPTKYWGRLIAFAANNTVIYGGLANQDITITGTALNTTTENTYFNLTLQGNGIKNILKDNITNRDLRVLGNLIIANTAQLDVQNTFFPTTSDIYIGGNWINTGTLANPFVERAQNVIFNGSTAQSLTANVAGGETFYNLTINNTSIGLTQVNNTITVTNTLALTDGLVHTGIYETNVSNNLLTSIINYSDTTYIDGYLRRSLLSSGGAYDFPVGNISAYELATVNFTVAHTVNNLLVNFSNLPAGTGLPLTEGANTFATVLNCGGTAPGTGNANDGVWTITPNTGTANYNLTLNGKKYSNAGTANTILKRVNATSPWTLLGSYVPASGAEPLIASRTGYSGFSQFAIGASTIPTAISIPDTQYSNLFLIYPNPASNIVYINFDNVNAKNSTVELHDVLGHKITDAISINNNQYIINRNGLANGIYVLKIKADEKIYTQKVIFE